MAKRVTVDDIRQMNDIYYVHKSYAEVARQTGWSASTVAKYVDKNYLPEEQREIIRFTPTKELEEFSTAIFKGVENLGELCVLSEEEKQEMLIFTRELDI